jgi:hypothetical protein
MKRPAEVAAVDMLRMVELHVRGGWRWGDMPCEKKGRGRPGVCVCGNKTPHRRANKEA